MIDNIEARPHPSRPVFLVLDLAMATIPHPQFISDSRLLMTYNFFKVWNYVIFKWRREKSSHLIFFENNFSDSESCWTSFCKLLPGFLFGKIMSITVEIISSAMSFKSFELNLYRVLSVTNFWVPTHTNMLVGKLFLHDINGKDCIVEGTTHSGWEKT